MGALVGSCATDVQLAFEKCRPGRVLTLSLLYNFWLKKKKQITF